MSKPLLSLNHNIAILQAGSLSLKVDVQHGARITSFTHENREVLTQRDEHAENFGSTLWDAPQSRWHWPPPAILDSSPYTSRMVGQQLEFSSAVDPASGLQFSKLIRAAIDGAGVDIEYRISNAGSEAITTAAWEITRAPGGLTFLPSSQLSDAGQSTLPNLQFAADHAWYAIDPSPLDVGKKAFFDVQQGWLAHITPNRLLFIKSFIPLAPQHYSSGHAAVEIYAHIDGAYVELENHGPQTLLEPGQSLRYAVRWLAEPVAAHIDVHVANPALVEFAQKILRAQKP